MSQQLRAEPMLGSLPAREVAILAVGDAVEPNRVWLVTSVRHSYSIALVSDDIRGAFWTTFGTPAGVGVPNPQESARILGHNAARNYPRPPFQCGFHALTAPLRLAESWCRQTITCVRVCCTSPTSFQPRYPVHDEIFPRTPRRRPVPDRFTRSMIVLYDGDCGFCRWAMAWLIRRDRHDLLVPAPIQSPLGAEVLADLAPCDRLASIHAVTDGGHRASGGAAAIVILGTLPSTRGLAALLRLSPSATEAAYGFVAAHRAAFGRLVSARSRSNADDVLSVARARRPTKIEEARSAGTPPTRS